MISQEALKGLIQDKIPEARVDMIDRTGQSDHFIVRVVSSAFEGKNPLDRHRMVYDAVDPALKDGRLHAIEIQTALS